MSFLRELVLMKSNYLLKYHDFYFQWITRLKEEVKELRNKLGDEEFKEKIKRNPDFKARYDLLVEKVAVVKKIIAYRIRYKLSQEQLAKELGVTQQYISKIEEGEFSNSDAIENILEHIGYRLRLEAIPA